MWHGPHVSRFPAAVLPQGLKATSPATRPTFWSCRRSSERRGSASSRSSRAKDAAGAVRRRPAIQDGRGAPEPRPRAELRADRLDSGACRTQTAAPATPELDDTPRTAPSRRRGPSGINDSRRSSGGPDRSARRRLDISQAQLEAAACGRCGERAGAAPDHAAESGGGGRGQPPRADLEAEQVPAAGPCAGAGSRRTSEISAQVQAWPAWPERVRRMSSLFATGGPLRRRRRAISTAVTATSSPMRPSRAMITR